MTINDKIQNLADQMGVSFDDVKHFAESIADSMVQDKVTPEMVKNDDDVALAYAHDQVRKTKAFTELYFTNDAAQYSINSAVYDGLKSV